MYKKVRPTTNRMTIFLVLLATSIGAQELPQWPLSTPSIPTSYFRANVFREYETLVDQNQQFGELSIERRQALSIYEFDEQGRLSWAATGPTRQYRSVLTGTPISFDQYEYDELNRVVEISSFSLHLGDGFIRQFVYLDSSQDVPSGSVMWEADQTGNISWFVDGGRIVRHSSYSYLGREERRILYEYNNEDLVTKIDHFRGGILSKREVYQYGEFERLQFHLVYETDGALSQRAEFTYPDSSDDVQVLERRATRNSRGDWGPILQTAWQLDDDGTPVSSRTTLEGQNQLVSEFSLQEHEDGSATVVMGNPSGITTMYLDRYGRPSYSAQAISSETSSPTRWTDWYEVEPGYPVHFAWEREKIAEVFGESVVDRRQLHIRFEIPPDRVATLHSRTIDLDYSDMPSIRVMLTGKETMNSILEEVLNEILVNIEQEFRWALHLNQVPMPLLNWLTERIIEEKINITLPAAQSAIVVGGR